MDGCKLIIEYEVDCTFEFPDEDTDTSKGKIRYSSPDIYFEYTAYSDSNLLSNTGKSVFSQDQLVF